MPFDLENNEKTALVIMDMQNDIVNERSDTAKYLGFAEPVKESGVIGNIQRLLSAFRKAEMQVVHVIVDFSVGKSFQMPHRGQFFSAIANAPPMLQKHTWGGQIHDDLVPLPEEPVVPKALFSAFAGTELHDVLQSRGISQLILTGVATDLVVDATSWSASDLGYDVIIPEDACVSADIQEHRNALKRMAARADITDVSTIVGAIG